LAVRAPYPRPNRLLALPGLSQQNPTITRPFVPGVPNPTPPHVPGARAVGRTGTGVPLGVVVGRATGLPRATQRPSPYRPYGQRSATVLGRTDFPANTILFRAREKYLVFGDSALEGPNYQAFLNYPNPTRTPNMA
jgi:hypothetical protein